MTDDFVPRTAQSRKRRWPVNLALMLMNVGLALIIPFSAITMSFIAQSNDIGLLNWLDISIWITFPLTILYLSFHNWAIHWALHTVPVLWRFHRVHHSDYDLDFTSAFRNHPIEIAIAAFIGAAAALLLGLNPLASFTSTMLVTLIAIMTHSRISLPERLDQIGQLVFVTPLMHHIHHSDHRPETNSNFGGDFSIWDRLFGTHLSGISRDVSEFGFGLKSDRPEQANDLDWVLVAPFSRQDQNRPDQ